MRVLMMSTRQRGRGSKYTDDFKRKLLAESSADGISVPMVAAVIGRCRNGRFWKMAWICLP
jgi:transposase-like protein